MSIEQLEGKVDAAILATPSETHAELGLELTAARSPSSSRSRLRPPSTKRSCCRGSARGRAYPDGRPCRAVQPAVLELNHLTSEVVHVDVARISPYSGRIVDGVILDLMIHDLDLVLSLVSDEVVSVSAVLDVSVGQRGFGQCAAHVQERTTAP